MPEGELLQFLHDDYGKMRNSGMLRDSAPRFDEILAVVAVLQEETNAICKGVPAARGPVERGNEETLQALDSHGGRAAKHELARSSATCPC